MISTLSYTDNSKSLMSKINANLQAIGMDNKGITNAVTVKNALTYSSFIVSMNSAIDLALTQFPNKTKMHVDISSASSGVLVSGINENIGVVYGQGVEYREESPSFFPILSQPTIPSKGVASILHQNGNWKLATYSTEQTLYLSSDNGATWGYSKAISFLPSTIRMAIVFADGSLMIATKANKIYSSQDHLATLNEITVSNLTFHTPVNASYPGLYFGVLNPETYTVDGVEYAVFGTYWQQADLNGATPINIYFTKDKGATISCIYKFGDNPSERDDGTGSAGATGNVVGNISNPVYCHHLHNIVYNPYNSKFYALVGDYDDEVGILEMAYISDTWSFTWHAMPDVDDFFRMAGMVFTPSNEVIWVSDAHNSGGIYKCTIDNLFSTNRNHHTALFLSNKGTQSDMITISEYGEFMMSCRYSQNPAIIASNDYGETWQEIPDNYGFQNLSPGNFAAAVKVFKKDSNGYNLIEHSTIAIQNPSYSFLMKLNNKPI